MSQHSATTTALFTGTTSATVESSAKPAASATASLENERSKDADVSITDDFVLMSTPDKFKDRNINETNVKKKYRTDTSPDDKINLDCLLLADTSERYGVPQHVKNFLLQHFDCMLLSQAEILFLLVYIVALESGFVSHSDYEEAKNYVDHLSANSSFHAKNILRLSHLKPNYQATALRTRFTLKLRTLINMETECTDYLYSLLTGFVIGDFLIVTLSPANSTGAKGFSTALSIGRYVVSIHAKNDALHQCFSKLTEFTHILRDKLFVPMRCQHLCWLDYCIYPSLNGLPIELYDNILKYLNRNQLNILANVNKLFYHLSKNNRAYVR